MDERAVDLYQSTKNTDVSKTETFDEYFAGVKELLQLCQIVSQQKKSLYTLN